MRLLVVASLILVALAGCADSEPQPEEDETFKDVEVKATSTTGAIRGVVVDPSITPVADVLVKLVGTEKTTTTTENGAFGFSNLEPGTYFIEVEKTAWIGTQASAIVEAGVENPPVTKIIITFNPDAVPHYTESQWRGFFTCSSAAFQICPAINLVFEIAGQPEPLNDEFLFVIPVEKPAQWITSELVWRSTQAAGDTLDFYLEHVSKNDENDWSHKRSTVGPSPIQLQVAEEEAAGHGFGITHDIQHRVFPGGITEDLPGSLIGVQIDQEYEIFNHQFFGYTPGEEWRFTDSGEVPQPPQ